jgi:hypothetical protein
VLLPRAVGDRQEPPGAERVKCGRFQRHRDAYAEVFNNAQILKRARGFEASTSYKRLKGFEYVLNAQTVHPVLDAESFATKVAEEETQIGLPAPARYLNISSSTQPHGERRFYPISPVDASAVVLPLKISLAAPIQLGIRLNAVGVKQAAQAEPAGRSTSRPQKLLCSKKLKTCSPAVVHSPTTFGTSPLSHGSSIPRSF